MKYVIDGKPVPRKDYIRHTLSKPKALTEEPVKTESVKAEPDETPSLTEEMSDGSEIRPVSAGE